MIKNTLFPRKEDFLAFCEKLVDAENDSLKGYGTVHLFENNPSCDELKHGALEALQDKRWYVRVKAIEGLSKAYLETKEQLLEMIRETFPLRICLRR